jgi:hypothetical protein
VRWWWYHVSTLPATNNDNRRFVILDNNNNVAEGKKLLTVVIVMMMMMIMMMQKIVAGWLWNEILRKKELFLFPVKTGLLRGRNRGTIAHNTTGSKEYRHNEVILPLAEPSLSLSTF